MKIKRFYILGLLALGVAISACQEEPQIVETEEVTETTDEFVDNSVETVEVENHDNIEDASDENLSLSEQLTNNAERMIVQRRIRFIYFTKRILLVIIALFSKISLQ